MQSPPPTANRLHISASNTHFKVLSVSNDFVLPLVKGCYQKALTEV